MTENRNPRSIKLRYTLKLIAGLAFLIFAIWLSYWLIFEYRVRNILGLGAMILFLIIPAVVAIATIPRELVALIAIWRSDEPASLEKAFGDLRERDEL